MKRCLLWCLLTGCAFKLDPGDDFLPLVGDPPSLDGRPQVTTGFDDHEIYHAADGRLWLMEPNPASNGKLMHSLDSPSQTLTVSEDTYNFTALAPEGLLTVNVPDPSLSAFHVELAVPGQPPFVVHDLDTGSLSVFPPNVIRGGGYFLVPGGGFTETPSWHLFFDDGHQDSFPIDDNRSSPYGEADDPYVGNYGQDASGLDRRYLLLSNLYDPDLFVYDLSTHAVSTLVPLPAPLQLFHNKKEVTPPTVFLYDQTREQLWLGGSSSSFADLASKTSVDLQTPALEMRLNSDGTVLLHAPSGEVYLVRSDGSRERLGHVEIYDLKASSGRNFVYSQPGHDDYDSHAFDGWLGDRQVIHAGLSEKFSADGTHLYWLEDATKNNSAGDLHSLDVRTGAVRHLARNVKVYFQLSDGRLVAISNDALDGAWNRAIVIDEQKGECRWLGQGLQGMVVVDDRVVGIRHSEHGYTAIPLDVPPK